MIKSSMLRLNQQNSNDNEANDTYTMHTLQSIHSVFR